MAAAIGANMARFVLKSLNWILNAAVALSLVAAGLFAAYALWDNGRIYAAAEDVQRDMLRLKPSEAAEDEGPTFDELLKINPDVCAWISMGNTHIDYPVLQGATNLTYINTDVYGNFALPGSIFLDTRCDRSFEGGYQLLYGHHMANGGMFGDLAQYKDEAFFLENRTGTLLVPGKIFALETFACLVISASDDAIFAPEAWLNDVDGLLSYARKNALYTHDDVIEGMLEQERISGVQPKVLALSTCSSEFSNARTIVLTVMRDPAPVQ